MFTPTSWPTWRGWAADWEQGATYAETGKQLDVVCDGILNDVGIGIKRWSQVIDLLTLMPADAKAKALDLLEAIQHHGLDDRTKSKYREKLLDYISRYRAAGATERIGEDSLARLQSIADALLPDSLTVQHSSLFGHAMDRYYMRARKYEENHRGLEGDRTAAVREVVEHCGFDGVLDLAREAAEPYSVGRILAEVSGDDFASAIIPTLISDEAWSLNFVYGFAGSRMEADGNDWLDLHLAECATDGQRARLLAMAPAVPETWDRVDAAGATVKSRYWSQVNHWGIARVLDNVDRSVSELVEVGRIAHAVDVLCAALHDDHLPQGDSLCLPLEAVLELPIEQAREQLEEIKDYEVGRVITAVQESPTVNEERKIRLEVNFLKMLGDDREGEPATLYGKLAREPEFFVEVLSYCFRSEHEVKGSDEPEDEDGVAEKRTRAHLGYDLLQKWRSLPGLSPDGLHDEAALRQWVKQARSVAEPLGYLDVCDRQVGEMMAHSPSDPDGTWPGAPVRRLAKEIATDRLAAGIYLGVINSRGVICRGEGGTQERELAEKYKSLADLIRVEHSFVAGVLDALAKNYLGEGRSWDEREEWER